MKFDTTRLKRQVEEQPLLAAGIAAALLKGASEVIKVGVLAQNSRTNRKEVNRRIRKDRRR